jgi:hypothetical protein
MQNSIVGARDDSVAGEVLSQSARRVRVGQDEHHILATANGGGVRGQNHPQTGVIAQEFTVARFHEAAPFKPTLQIGQACERQAAGNLGQLAIDARVLDLPIGSDPVTRRAAHGIREPVIMAADESAFARCQDLGSAQAECFHVAKTAHALPVERGA